MTTVEANHLRNHPLVLVEKKCGIFTLSLNRKEKRNALNIHLLESLANALKEVMADETLRVIIIRGKGSCFSTGLDLNEALDESTTENSSLLLAEVLGLIYNSKAVTIAAVHGHALAGGAGLMSACDFAISAENTCFGYPEVKRGLVASQVMVFLDKLVNRRHLAELLLLGEIIDANRALTMGLISKVVKEVELMEEAYKVAEKCKACGPLAIAKTKELLKELTGNIALDLPKMMNQGIKIRGTDEAKEGLRAFLEHRTPNF
jgi:methylglutaconyl-CoA hydratase